ncbi:MAG: metal ABC transporter permease [Gemmataceae bacterium]|nr:metal ABC transporter permease [Gemmataceae bacterium]
MFALGAILSRTATTRDLSDVLLGNIPAATPADSGLIGGVAGAAGLVLLALTVVTAIQVIGLILTAVLLVTPAATASLVTTRLPRAMGWRPGGRPGRGAGNSPRTTCGSLPGQRSCSPPPATSRPCRWRVGGRATQAGVARVSAEMRRNASNGCRQQKTSFNRSVSVRFFPLGS